MGRTIFRTYDDWKLASPEDEPGRTYSCDCCGKDSTNVEQCWTTTGLETWACPACRGDEEEPIEYCPRCAMPALSTAGVEWPDCHCPKE